MLTSALPDLRQSPKEATILILHDNHERRLKSTARTCTVAFPFAVGALPVRAAQMSRFGHNEARRWSLLWNP